MIENPASDLSFDRTKRGQFMPVGPIVLAAAATANVYERSGTVPNGQIQVLKLQNVGTGTIKVNINDDATANEYVRVLAVDTGAEAGAGGTLDIPIGVDISKVSVFSTAGSKLAVLLVTNPSLTRY